MSLAPLPQMAATPEGAPAPAMVHAVPSQCCMPGPPPVQTSLGPLPRTAVKPPSVTTRGTPDHVVPSQWSIVLSASAHTSLALLPHMVVTVLPCGSWLLQHQPSPVHAPVTGCAALFMDCGAMPSVPGLAALLAAACRLVGSFDPQPAAHTIALASATLARPLRNHRRVVMTLSLLSSCFSPHTPAPGGTARSHRPLSPP